jgi:hypothetical protein
MSLENKKSFLSRDSSAKNKKPSSFFASGSSNFLSASPSGRLSFYSPPSFGITGVSGDLGEIPPYVEPAESSITVPINTPLPPLYYDVTVLIHNESTTTDKFNILYSSNNGASWETFQTSASVPSGADYYGYSWLSVPYAGDLWIALQTEDNQDLYFGSGQYTITSDYTSFYGKTNPYKLINATSGSVPGFNNRSGYLGLYLNINVVDSEYVLGPYFESNFQGDSYYDNGYIE